MVPAEGNGVPTAVAAVLAAEVWPVAGVGDEATGLVALAEVEAEAVVKARVEVGSAAREPLRELASAEAERQIGRGCMKVLATLAAAAG